MYSFQIPGLSGRVPELRELSEKRSRDARGAALKMVACAAREAVQRGEFVSIFALGCIPTLMILNDEIAGFQRSPFDLLTGDHPDLSIFDPRSIGLAFVFILVFTGGYVLKFFEGLKQKLPLIICISIGAFVFYFGLVYLDVYLGAHVVPNEKVLCGPSESGAYCTSFFAYGLFMTLAIGVPKSVCFAIFRRWQMTPDADKR
jgi:hypothetical protein